nr:MAG: damage-inducible protein DinB [Hyphomicrobiales bacterium]
MLDRSYVQKMARYNRWQNENLYSVANALTEEERLRERSAFFGSIHKTLNHILWGDRMWMSRFADMPRPEGGIKGSTALYDDWDALCAKRIEMDAAIIDWADHLDADWIAGELSWISGVTQREMTHPKWMLVAHMFNHQTHHRGQVHCMLTQAGGKPHDTDLAFMPE